MSIAYGRSIAAFNGFINVGGHVMLRPRGGAYPAVPCHRPSRRPMRTPPRVS
jgi:hypothetical protein